MAILRRESSQHRPATAPAGKPCELLLDASLVRCVPMRQRVLIAAHLQRNVRRIACKRFDFQPTAPSSCTKLPPELLSEIVSHLVDDKATLACCSLVDHAWFYASRPYLFRRLEVSWISLANMTHWQASYMPRADENWDAYSRRCRTQLGGAPLTLALLRFLDTAGDIVRNSVRELRFVGWQHDACLLAMDDVAAVLEHLPLLRTLELTRTTLRWTGDDLLAKRHPLRRLRVHDSCAAGSAAFGLLSLVPALEELLWDVDTDPDECDIGESQLLGVLEGFALPRLRRLGTGRALYPHHSPEALALLVQGMCMRGAPPALRTLELDVLLDAYDPDALDTVLAEAGPGLHTLRMELGCVYPTRVAPRTGLGLCHCADLRELELSIPSYWVPDALELVPSLLADLWSGRETLSGLTLVLRFDSALQNFAHLRLLDDELVRYLKHGLSSVTIRRGRGALDTEARASVSEALPLLHEHGALLLL